MVRRITDDGTFLLVIFIFFIFVGVIASGIIIGYIENNTISSDPVERYIYLHLTSVHTAGGNDPDVVNIPPGFLSYSFSADREEEVFFDIKVPEDRKEGTNITFHVTFFVDDVDTTTERSVVWVIEYQNFRPGRIAEFTNTTTVYSQVKIPTTTQDKEILESTNMTIVADDLTPDDIILARLYRDVDDTWAVDDHPGDIRLFNIHAHYVANKLGDEIT